VQVVIILTVVVKTAFVSRFCMVDEVDMNECCICLQMLNLIVTVSLNQIQTLFKYDHVPQKWYMLILISAVVLEAWVLP
jgi:hypothetical protein